MQFLRLVQQIERYEYTEYSLNLKKHTTHLTTNFFTVIF